jgi:hypothetical protein
MAIEISATGIRATSYPRESQDDIERVNDNELTDWRRADLHPPTVVGHYEVRNCGGWPRRKRLVAGFVNGRQMRYWDGARWLDVKGGSKSIMGSHFSHQYRGLRSPAQ